MSLGPIPLNAELTAKGGAMSGPWRAWFSALFGIVKPIGVSGTTAERPIAAPNNVLYVSQGYFDTTLGKPIWIKSLNPTVWVDATGGVV